MKRIVVELNPKSVIKAINYLKAFKTQFREMTDEFLEFACEWVIARANSYIDNADLGSLVKLELKNSWSYTVSKGVAHIQNNGSFKKKHRVQTPDGRTVIQEEEVPTAILVEFGVGVVGQGSPHPNAGVEGYAYNLPTNSKDSDGMWYFWTNSNELDLPLSAVEDIRGHDEWRGREEEQGKRIVVGTRGAQGVMYAYNALADARMDLQNPNGDFAKEWNKLKARYGLV